MLNQGEELKGERQPGHARRQPDRRSGAALHAKRRGRGSFPYGRQPAGVDADGWKDGEPSFFSVNVWRDQAEHASRSLRKGSRRVVIGRLKARSWETPEGQRRSLVEVEA